MENIQHLHHMQSATVAALMTATNINPGNGVMANTSLENLHAIPPAPIPTSKLAVCVAPVANIIPTTLDTPTISANVTDQKAVMLNSKKLSMTKAAIRARERRRVGRQQRDALRCGVLKEDNHTQINYEGSSSGIHQPSFTMGPKNEQQEQHLHLAQPQAQPQPYTKFPSHPNLLTQPKPQPQSQSQSPPMHHCLVKVCVNAPPRYGKIAAVRKARNNLRSKILLTPPCPKRYSTHPILTPAPPLTTLLGPTHLIASILPSALPPPLAFRALGAYSLLRTLSKSLRLSPFAPHAFLRALSIPYQNKLS